MSNQNKVAEIFINAGTAFSKLGEMTMELQKDEAKSCGSGKWTEEEIQLLKESVYRFGQDIEKISQMVRSRTAKQIKEAMKRRNLLIVKGNNGSEISANETQSESNPVEKVTLANPDGNEEENAIKENNTTRNSLGSDHEVDVDVVNDISGQMLADGSSTLNN